MRIHKALVAQTCCWGPRFFLAIRRQAADLEKQVCATC